MDSDSAAGGELARLRAEIATLRALMQLALNTNAERGVLATAKLLRVKTTRLEELETPAWIE